MNKTISSLEIVHTLASLTETGIATYRISYLQHFELFTSLQTSAAAFFARIIDAYNRYTIRWILSCFRPG